MQSKNIEKINRLSSVDLAYLAGIFDGDGCIFIKYYKNKYLYILMIKIVNTDRNLMKWLIEKVGGSFSKMKRCKSNHRQAYQWQISGLTAEIFLRQIFPYLIIKKERVNLGLKFRELLIGPGKKVPKKNKELRIKLCLQMRELNKRGI